MDKIKVFFKLSCAMFIVLSLVSVITLSISSDTWVKFSVEGLDLVYIFIYSLIFGFFNINNYSIYSVRITSDEVKERNLIDDLYEIMKKMHWLLEYHDDKKIVFKSRRYKTIWREYVVINIGNKDTEIIGSRIIIRRILNKAEIEII